MDETTYAGGQGGQGMRAISLWQPWASFIACGLKQYETRSWEPHPSAILEPLAIHAAKRKMTKEELEYLDQLRETYGAKRFPTEYPLGQVIAICKLNGVYATQRHKQHMPISIEVDIGDWSPGRFAWHLVEVQRVKPVEFKGSQKFFVIPDSLLKLEVTA